MQGLNDLCDHLGYSAPHLFSLVKYPNNLYRSALIPKRSGSGYRELKIPISELKGIQRTILSTILETHPPSQAAYAYVRERGVVAAGHKLTGPGGLLAMDIDNFFPTITAKRVSGLFRSFGYNDSVTKILTDLCTFNGTLPQGAPTSPAISNLILRKFDAEVLLVSEVWELIFVRYADDLFFKHKRNFNKIEFSNIISGLLNNNGFSANIDKTRYYANGYPARVLGLLVDTEKLRLSKSSRRKMRSQFYRASKNLAWGRANIQVLEGQLQWHKAVYGRDHLFEEYKSIIGNIKVLRLHDSYRTESPW